MPAFKKDLNISDSLSSSISDPLSPIEEKLITHLIKRKIDQEGKFIRCKTRGQPIFLQIVSKPRKDITDVSIGSNNVTTHRVHSNFSNKIARLFQGF